MISSSARTRCRRTAFGYLQRSITLEIERFISDTEWSQEGDEEVANTPLNVQSNIIYRRLVNSGWLREDRIGVKNYVTMPTTVQKFLELLRQFAEEGPQIIAGKVQLIHNQIEQVLADPARQASGFHEAAQQARQLIITLSATTMRVREAIDLLSAQETTAAFVRAFFDDYIGQLYIRDYHELRTQTHPLRHRWRIIQAGLAVARRCGEAVRHGRLLPATPSVACLNWRPKNGSNATYGTLP